MILKKIAIQHFRNVAFTELSFTGRQQYFLGENGQGKTNLLEAAAFFTALRSFRTSDNRALIARGHTHASLSCVCEHEERGETRIVVHLRPGGKEVLCDGERVTRLADYLGKFPVVVFSSTDQNLIRGGPSVRRRWLDLILSGVDAGYLQALQQYHRAMEGRNSLLKSGASTQELESFEQPLAKAACVLVEKRTEMLQPLSAVVGEAYARISGGRDRAGLAYAPDHEPMEVEAWAALFEQSRTKDQFLKMTTAGPHRDDCELLIDGRSAKDFGSEGQQRSLVIALRLAEADFLRMRLRVRPVLLADDVLGELDAGRRERFWASIGGENQVLATGTAKPAASLGAWQFFDVKSGEFTESPSEEAAP